MMCVVTCQCTQSRVKRLHKSLTSRVVSASILNVVNVLRKLFFLIQILQEKKQENLWKNEF